MTVTKFKKDETGRWVRIYYTMNGLPQTVVTWKRNLDECRAHVEERGGLFNRAVKYDAGH